MMKKREKQPKIPLFRQIYNAPPKKHQNECGFQWSQVKLDSFVINLSPKCPPIDHSFIGKKKVAILKMCFDRYPENDPETDPPRKADSFIIDYALYSK